MLGIDTRILHRIAAIRDVDAALRDDRIEAHYQPIFRLDTREIVAVEALCRLRMANGGLLAAAAFREATTDIHLASELTQRMLEIVARDLRQWQDQSIPIDYIGVNVSIADFHGGQLARQITGTFADQGLSLANLVIELPEEACRTLWDKGQLEMVETLRIDGLRIALDDFGIAGGRLMSLLKIPVDMVKIDTTLIDRLAIGNPVAAVVGGLLHTAAELGLPVIAEGIENLRQISHLTQKGCRFGQGHFLCRPLNFAAASSLLSSSERMKEGRATRHHHRYGFEDRIRPSANEGGFR